MDKLRPHRPRLLTSHLAVSLALLSAVSTSRVQAQSIIPSANATTGTVVTETGNQYTITGGTTSADQQNLFHTFHEFNLLTGERATFVADPIILNILGRVAGGSPSLIDGLLEVVGSEANLFLLNPNGILLGPNSALNLQGSFTAVTADQVNFATGAFGTVGTPDYAALVGPPTGFRFSAANPGGVVNRGTLAVNPGEAIALIGGQVLNTGTLSAPGGNVVIGAIAGEQLVRIEQEGLLLNLELETVAEADVAPLPFTPLSLPELLTGQVSDEAVGITVNTDGTVQLTSGMPIATHPGALTVTGTIDVADDQGGQVWAQATTADLPAGLIDISGTTAGGNLAIYADQRLSLGLTVNAAGGGVALFDPPTLEIDAAAATTIAGIVAGGGTSIQSAADTINVNAPITVVAGTGGTLSFTDENTDGILTINLNELISLSAGHTLTGEGSTINVNVTDAGIVQTGLNVAAAGGTVNLAAGTYQEGREILLARDVTLRGAGAASTRLDGDQAHQVLQVADGVTARIHDVTIRNGVAIADGGGIENRGTLTLANSRLTGNTADRRGGGIENRGTLTLTNSTLSGNTANIRGGGIFNHTGSLTITDSILSGNTANNSGGGIDNIGTLSITNSTLSDNATRFGGSIFNSGTLTVINSTLSDNTADFSGSGIFINDMGTSTVANSTLSGNTADYFGGGINNRGTATVTNSTLSGNTANRDGGGILSSEEGIVELSNSIIANNAASNGSDLLGRVTSLGFNLIGNSTGVVGWAASDRLNIDPRLGPLTDYGGPTQTQALLPDSPAIDAGGVGATATDQRGVAALDVRDIGAYESAGFVWLPVAGDGQSTLVNMPFTTPLQVQLAEAAFGRSIAFENLAVTFRAPTSGASGNFSGTSTVLSNTQGIATAPFLTANGIVGNFTVTATSPGTGGAIFNLNNILSPSVLPNPLSTVNPCPNGCVTISPPFPLSPPADLLLTPPEDTSGADARFTLAKCEDPKIRITAFCRAILLHVQFESR